MDVCSLYGDFFSESVDELQKLLNSFYVYSADWNLIVTVEKTKVVTFRNGG